MDITLLSSSFHVRKLNAKDIEKIYSLSVGNRIFYEFHPPFVTRDSIQEDMDALPPGKAYEDKFYIGFFSEDNLVAMMDLIRDFPEKHIAFIGLFMMDQQYQGRGIGSKIIGECVGRLRKFGFHAVRIGVDKENPQSFAFWQKNGFVTTAEDSYIRMELVL